MSARRIRVQSNGHEVTVWIYPTRESMLTAATRWSGNHFEDDTGAVTQAAVDSTTREAVTVVVRLYEGALGTEVVCHEMHHAATAIYARLLPEKIVTADEFNHYNEPFAYLYSDLFSRLVRRLYALGYYDGADRDRA